VSFASIIQRGSVKRGEEVSLRSAAVGHVTRGSGQLSVRHRAIFTENSSPVGAKKSAVTRISMMQCSMATASIQSLEEYTRVQIPSVSKPFPTSQPFRLLEDRNMAG